MITKIVIVEDDHQTADLLQDLARELDLQADVYYDAKSFLKTSRNEFCIYIIDRNLGAECGTKLIKKIRETDPISPVFMISGNFEHSDIVSGLSSGADDYLVKPFTFEVLKVKIMNACEKSKSYATHNRHVKVLSEARLIIKDDKRLSLTGREFEVFEKLYKQSDRVLTRNDILDGIEGEDITARNVDVVIYTLRKKLAPIGVNIVTHRGTGYQIEMN